MRTTRYHLTTTHPGVHFTAAVIADLHDHGYGRIIHILERERPDIILIPGDLTEWLHGDPESTPRPGLELLREASAIAPTFYAFGNHEIGACHRYLRHARRVPEDQRHVPTAWRELIAESGATLLDDAWVTWRNITIGGVGSGLWRHNNAPDLERLAALAEVPGYKLLLCHHPEYYPRYLCTLGLDMIVSGHAHGGQWRIFGRGVYAPDQHLFPRYTSGVHDGCLVISRGTSNTARPIPRFFNPREVVMMAVSNEITKE